MVVSSYLTLQDGTEYDIRTAASGRCVVVGEGLEKLMRLEDTANVTFCDTSRTWGDVKLRVGEIAAYIPNVADYLKVCNYL